MVCWATPVQSRDHDMPWKSESTKSRHQWQAFDEREFRWRDDGRRVGGAAIDSLRPFCLSRYQQHGTIEIDRRKGGWKERWKIGREEARNGGKKSVSVRCSRSGHCHFVGTFANPADFHFLAVVNLVIQRCIPECYPFPPFLAYTWPGLAGDETRALRCTPISATIRWMQREMRALQSLDIG